MCFQQFHHFSPANDSYKSLFHKSWLSSEVSGGVDVDGYVNVDVASCGVVSGGVDVDGYVNVDVASCGVCEAQTDGDRS